MITGRNSLTFITGEMLASSCFSRKVSGNLHQKGGSSSVTSFKGLGAYIRCEYLK